MPDTTPSTTSALRGWRGGLGQRGAATTEFAVSLILLVPLVIGLSFVGETFSAAAKVQEAEIEAGWEITAYLLHDYTGHGGDARYNGVFTDVNTRLNADMYFGLNSFDGSQGGMVGRTLPYLTVSPINLNCESFEVPTIGTTNEPAFKPLLPYDSLASYRNDGAPDNSIYRNTISASQYFHAYTPPSSGRRNQAPSFYKTYITCRGQVSVSQNLQGTDQALEKWTHQGGLLSGVSPTFSFCGIGEGLRGCGGPSDGNTYGGVVLLTDDWGLEDGTSNPMGTTDNPSYFNVGQAIYGGGVGAQTVDKAMRGMIGVGDQSDSNAFKSGYQDHLPERWSVDNDVGPDTQPVWTYLTPFETQGSAPQMIYDQRRNTRYLGNSSPTFEDSP